MGDGARFKMEQGTYLPPTRFAPCHQPYRTPASYGAVPEGACIERPTSHAGDLGMLLQPIMPNFEGTRDYPCNWSTLLLLDMAPLLLVDPL